jgi:glycosyltransferase involved in cell wall biosynthesis
MRLACAEIPPRSAADLYHSVQDMSGLHVVRVAEQFPPLRGGLSPAMLALSLEQHRRGHRITVITRDFGQPAPADGTLPFPVIRLRSRSLMHFGWQVADVLRRLPVRPDIVHCHGPAAAPILVRQRRGAPPVVLTLHAVRRYQYGLYRDLHQLARSVERATSAPVRNPPRNYSAWQPRIAWELRTERYLCRKADHLALVAEYFGPLLEEYYAVPPDRCTVTYNGSDFHPGAGLDKGAARASLGLPADAQVILFVGRLEWQKRIQLLVQAMPSFLLHVEQARLLIVGEGEQRDDLALVIRKLGLEKHVQLVEWVEHSRLQDFYRAADCLCLPSIWEGLSKVLLEAMSMQLPVVAADNVANREVLRGGEAGFLVSEPNPDCWASALCDVLRSPDAARNRAARASTLVDEQYRWSHVADRLDRVYQGLT